MRCARHDGYTLHANVHLAADDRDGLERLCRYGARPPFALSRLSRLRDGRVAYQVKKRFGAPGRTLVLSTHELLLLLAALTPIPRANLLRYHGVFAPNAKHRASVVAKAQKPATASDCPRTRDRNDRIDWASLLRRTYKVDVLSCRICGGKAKGLAVIEDDAVVKKILSHLGLRTEALPLAPIRSPAQRELPFAPRFDELVAEEPQVDDLPAWMREPPARARMRARGPREWTDEDEVVPVERLPAWMRQRSWVGPAPPNRDGIDAPSPGAEEAFADPIYEEPTS